MAEELRQATVEALSRKSSIVSASAGLANSRKGESILCALIIGASNMTCNMTLAEIRYVLSRRG